MVKNKTKKKNTFFAVSSKELHIQIPGDPDIALLGVYPG